MKRILISLLTVGTLIMAALPFGAQPVYAAASWPTSWQAWSTDPTGGSCSSSPHRDVSSTSYATDSQYLYLRMGNVDPAGWPVTGPHDKLEEARYKWWFDTAGTAASVSGNSVNDAEFLLILEDLTDQDASLPTETGDRDQLGELTLMDDLTAGNFMARWNSTNPPLYTTNTPATVPSPSTLWLRELGTGTAGAGGPQGVIGTHIGYRIDGNFVDMYISWASLGNPSQLCLIWATDIHNPNLDQAPSCDSPSASQCLGLVDFGDAPDPTYPTLLANSGAGHVVDSLWMGATIDTDPDGQPDATATGDDLDIDGDDEDGVMFDTPLVPNFPAQITVTASAAGKLDAWIDWNGDGSWATGIDQVFSSQVLGAGANTLGFTVPIGATPNITTFARFRLSSAGGLSYTGLAVDGEVEDYEVTISEQPTCHLTCTPDDCSACLGETVTVTEDGGDAVSWVWSGTAGGSGTLGVFTATSSGTVIVEITDSNDCTNTCQTEVTVYGLPTVDAGSDQSFCLGDDPITLSGDPPGGDWSGSGVSGTTFDPDVAGVGTHTITYIYTDQNGCSNSDTRLFTVESCITPPPPSGGSTRSCYFDFVMLDSEEFTIRVDCCNDTTFSSHIIFDPDEKHFITFDRNTAVICGDCVGCGHYPLLVVMTISDDPPQDPDYGVIVGPVYEIKGYKGKKVCSSVTLGKPVVLLLNYDPDDLPGDTTSVFVAFYNEETGEWERLQSPGGIAEFGVARGEMNHMSSFAVIAEIEEPAPPEPPTPTPTPPAPEPEAPAPAHFVASDLNITTGKDVTGIGNMIFVVKTGETVKISTKVANDGGQSGNYAALLKINGETKSTREITLSPGQGQELVFNIASIKPGKYVAQIDDLTGEFTVVRWTNWPLIAGLATAFGLLVWAIWYLFYRRRSRYSSRG